MTSLPSPRAVEVPVAAPASRSAAGSTPGAAGHSASASALGYQYQTIWGLLELLRRRADRPDLTLTLELFDDVAWDDQGTARELLQLKHHITRKGHLGDASTDLWRTIKVWIDGASPDDPFGPVLTLVSTSTAADGSAAALLRAGAGRDPVAALALLESVAQTSKTMETKPWRQAFLSLTPTGRQTFVSRMYVADDAPGFDEIETEIKEILWPVIPSVGETTYLDLVWAWWGRAALDMLRGRRAAISVKEVRRELESIRDTFTDDNLPTLVERAAVDEDQVVLDHGDKTFFRQMLWIGIGPKNLTGAVIDYYRAYTQTTMWVDRDLVGLAELEEFADRLKDEWERLFEDMIEDLGPDATAEQKQTAGKGLFRQLRDSALTIRARYTDPFFARGKRHELADSGCVGWHPDFEAHLKQLLLGQSVPA